MTPMLQRSACYEVQLDFRMTAISEGNFLSEDAIYLSVIFLQLHYFWCHVERRATECLCQTPGLQRPGDDKNFHC